jgi:plasmid stability protein
MAAFRTMADVKVRNLDERVARALRSRAKSRGVSLEEEVRRSLAEVVALRQEAFARRAAACRGSVTSGRRNRRPSDSAVIIRRERNAWG